MNEKLAWYFKNGWRQIVKSTSHDGSESTIVIAKLQNKDAFITSYYNLQQYDHEEFGEVTIKRKDWLKSRLDIFIKYDRDNKLKSLLGEK